MDVYLIGTVALVGLAGVGLVSNKASAYFTKREAADDAAKKSDEMDAALARITAGMSRIAGTISLDLAPLIKPGMNVGDLTVVKNAALADGVKQITERFPNDVALLGPSADLLGSMLHGEVGKVLAPAIAQIAATTAIPAAAASATAAVGATLDETTSAAKSLNTVTDDMAKVVLGDTPAKTDTPAAAPQTPAPAATLG